MSPEARAHLVSAATSLVAAVGALMEEGTEAERSPKPDEAAEAADPPATSGQEN